MTRPFLQDLGHNAFCLGVFATGDFFDNTLDVGLDRPASNQDGACAILSGSPFGWPDSQDRLPSFSSAKDSFWHAGKPLCHSSVDSLLGDSEQKDPGSGRIGSWGSWFASLRNHKPSGAVLRPNNKNHKQSKYGKKRNSVGKTQEVNPGGLPITVDHGVLFHRRKWLTFSPMIRTPPMRIGSFELDSDGHL